MNFRSVSWIKLCLLLVYITVFSFNISCVEAPEKNIKAKDGLLVAADWYPAGGDTTLLMIHSGGGNRSEFRHMTAKLNAYDFNLLLIDVRTGNWRAGVRNVTRDRASLNLYHLNPLWDFDASVGFIQQKKPGSKIVLVGVGANASIIVEHYRRWETAVDGMILISPGTIFLPAGFELPLMMISDERGSAYWTKEVLEKYFTRTVIAKGMGAGAGVVDEEGVRHMVRWLRSFKELDHVPRLSGHIGF